MRQRISPLPNVDSMEAMTHEMKEHIGSAYSVSMVIFKNRIGYNFLDGDEYSEVGLSVFLRLKKDPSILKKMIGEIKEIAPDFIKILKRIDESRLKTMEKKELIEF